SVADRSRAAASRLSGAPPPGSGAPSLRDALPIFAFAGGFASLGTFSRTFRDVVGVSPSTYRERTAGDVGPAPTCVRMAWQRPREASSFGEAKSGRTDLVS